MTNLKNIRSLYYITHVNNLPSILNQGILSHRKVEESGISYTAIYDSGVINRRKDKSTPEKSSLWDYANLYFQPRNPMMYRVMSEKNLDKKDIKDIAVIGIKPGVLNLSLRMSPSIAEGHNSNTMIQIILLPSDKSWDAHILIKPRKLK